MYYFSKETLIEAFNSLKDNVENKLLGILSILKSIDDNIIEDNHTYCIDTKKIAIILDEWCYMSGDRGNYSESYIYVKFSTHWKEIIKDTFIKKKNISIFSLIVFLYKLECFIEKPTYNDLIDRFCNDFHISQSIVYEWFNADKQNLDFSQEPIKKDFLKKTFNLTASTLSFSAPYSVQARAGELSRAPFIQTLYAGMDSIKCLLILKENIDLFYNPTPSKAITRIDTNLKPRQIIFYGAPGTGKSHSIEVATAGKSVIRTTFHPDSDYSTFVGAYKPTMTEAPIRNNLGQIFKCDGSVLAVNKDYDLKDVVTEKKITYEFVAQAFLKAYIKAWQNYPKEQYLVIEEINRGNCAQIFGDLFQLLDRDADGFSGYSIDADDDIRRYIEEQNIPIESRPGLEADLDRYATEHKLGTDGRTIGEMVKSGKKLLLPKNLYIWATMNTSDQSLFPIDSAFKRRWDWKYFSIADAGLDWIIDIEVEQYKWWSFVDLINKKIKSATESEDKKIGYFFVNANDNHRIVDIERFVGKVLFYFWNDVLKDFPLAENDVLLKDGDDSLSFENFYDANGAINKEKVKLFLDNLGTEKVDSVNNTSTPKKEPEATKGA